MAQTQHSLSADASTRSSYRRAYASTSPSSISSATRTKTDAYDRTAYRGRQRYRDGQAYRDGQPYRTGRAVFSEGESEDPAFACDDHVQKKESSGLSFFARYRKAKESFLRTRAKKRAERKYRRSYVATDAHTAASRAQAASANDAGSATDAQGGSSSVRAAVYKTDMGTSHRRSVRMQKDSAKRRSVSSARAIEKKRNGKAKLVVAASVVGCLILAGLFLYAPAQEYYRQMREYDRLQAEYDAISQRNETLQSSVDYLSTDQGIEDQARSEYGMVLEGEVSGNVSGLVSETDSEFSPRIVSDSIEMPTTWYSVFLDPFFGVE